MAGAHTAPFGFRFALPPSLGCSPPHPRHRIPIPTAAAPALVAEQAPRIRPSTADPCRETPGGWRQAGVHTCLVRPDPRYRSGEQNHIDLETKCLSGLMGTWRCLGTGHGGTGAECVAPQLPGVMSSPPAALSSHYHLPYSTQFWRDEGRQREGTGETRCFAVAVATVVSLAARAHISRSYTECELLTCEQIIFFPLPEKSPPVPPQQPEPRRCC